MIQSTMVLSNFKFYIEKIQIYKNIFEEKEDAQLTINTENNFFVN